jgi:hypothetical protein
LRFHDYQPMPRYYFITSHNDEPTDLPDAIDLPNVESAWHEATKAAGEILKDIDGNLRPGTEWSIQVQDESRKPVRTLRVIAEAHK